MSLLHLLDSKVDARQRVMIHCPGGISFSRMEMHGAPCYGHPVGSPQAAREIDSDALLQSPEIPRRKFRQLHGWLLADGHAETEPTLALETVASARMHSQACPRVPCSSCCCWEMVGEDLLVRRGRKRVVFEVKGRNSLCQRKAL